MNAADPPLEVFYIEFSSSDGIPAFEIADDAWTADVVNQGGPIINNIFGNQYGSASTFPVEWLKFEATPLNQQDVQLDWATATEINNSHFAIERSVDGTLFETVGRVRGAGNTNEVQEYTYIDEQVNSSQLYYRLKQVDLNGAFEYSETVQLDFSKYPELKGVDFEIYPSPTSDVVHIEANGTINDNFVIRVTDLLGRVVHEEQVDTQNGKNTLRVSKLSEGIYYVSLTDVKTNTVYGLGKFVKE